MVTGGRRAANVGAAMQGELRSVPIRLLRLLAALALGPVFPAVSPLAGVLDAVAAERPVAAERLQLKDKRRLRVGVPRIARSLRLRTTDASVAAPAPGSPSDPSIGGAAFYLLHAEASGESAVVDLPAAGWSRDGDRWVYRSRTRSAAGAAKTDVVLADGSIDVRIRDKSGRVLRYTLDEPSQASLAAVFDLGGGAERYCMEFAATAGRDEGSSAPDCSARGLFQAGTAVAPAACPDLSSAPLARDVCDAFDLLDLLVAAQMEASGIPGLGAAIVRAGEPLWSKGYGERHVAPSRPVLATTPFMLASISKTVTATAILQLVEDGTIGLDQDIDSILDFALDNPRVPGDETITVRHLLTHTSGLVDDEDVWGGYPGEPGSLYVLGDSPISLRDFLVGYFTPGGAWYDPVRNFAADPPGTRFEYSNLATALLGYLVEAASAAALDAHSDAEIFAPLAMEDTGWHLADFVAGDVAMPYESFGGDFYEWGQYGYPDYPDGQLRASATDLARFLAAWASGGVLDGERILEEATVAEALTVQNPAVDPAQGLSWYFDTLGGRAVVGHNGGDYGATTDMFFEPASGNGVVVLVNTDDTPARLRAMARIEDALFAIAEAP